MPRYLIEIAHDDEHAACVSALRTIEQYGSHFLTHAEWGCKSGVHCGWLVVELNDRDEAMQLVPPEYRQEVRIIELNRFTKGQIAALIKELEGK